MQDSYVKSRRIYLLVAATLFSWEYFGFRITGIPGLEAQFVDGQVAIVPRLMAVVCLYMIYRVTIDWLFFRPSEMASRIDFVVVHTIGLFALGAYLFKDLYPSDALQFHGLVLGYLSTLYFFLFLLSLSNGFLNTIPQDSFLKILRIKVVSLAFWSGSLFATVLLAYGLDNFGFLSFNSAAIFAGSIGFVLFLPLLFLMFSIPKFVSNSEEGIFVSRINQALDAEQELEEIKRSKDS